MSWLVFSDDDAVAIDIVSDVALSSASFLPGFFVGQLSTYSSLFCFVFAVPTAVAYFSAFLGGWVKPSPPLFYLLRAAATFIAFDYSDSAVSVFVRRF